MTDRSVVVKMLTSRRHDRLSLTTVHCSALDTAGALAPCVDAKWSLRYPFTVTSRKPIGYLYVLVGWCCVRRLGIYRHPRTWQYVALETTTFRLLHIGHWWLFGPVKSNIMKRLLQGSLCKRPNQYNVILIANTIYRDYIRIFNIHSIVSAGVLTNSRNSVISIKYNEHSLIF